MAVPYTFSTATGSLPLSQLDSNFSTAITIGNTAVVLGDTITTINNLTLANVAITSVSTAFPNGYLANSNVIVGTTTLTLGSTVTSINGLSLSNVTISSGNVTISNVTTTNVTATTANVTTANVGTLVVIGDATVGGNTTVTGNITAAKGTFTSANVTGTANVQIIAVTQNATVAGNVTITGNVSAANGTFTSANISGTSNISTLVVTGTSSLVGVATLTANPVLSAGTANGVTYLNGSKSLTSGTGLVFDGTNLNIGTATSVTNRLLNIQGSAVAKPVLVQTTTTNSLIEFNDSGTTNKPAMGSVGDALTFWPAGTEGMRLTSTGLGIGTSSPARKLHVVGTIGSYNSANDSQILMYNNGTVGSISVTYGTTGSYLPLTFLTSDTERMRIDSSGRLLLGTSTVFDSAYTMSLKVVSSTGGLIIQPGADNYTAIAFNNAAGVGKGSISVSATATTYNTSSDYRLKENVQPMSGALAKVSALKPVTYKWKIDGTDSQGFIAHELAEVCPHAVTGEKDAVDADGNPKYQGIDTSFLVATLTAAIQEQQALITALTARITALEAK